MNAPIPPAAVAINQTIALDLLSPSPTNPRERFDEGWINELAESIKTQGILQPLLVREVVAGLKPAATNAWPFPTKGEPDNRQRYEIIAGECRYRAAKRAELTEVPVLIRNLTDLQVLHAQIIENVQRKGLHPLEEAKGYERLIELGSKAEELGTEIGKSRAYVYARLKLLDLCEVARKAFFDGKFEASTALLIARIPHHKLQMEALKQILDRDLSYRQAKEFIQRDYMLELAGAPFDTKDATLLPKAGACTACMKCTGNQPDLFSDVKSKNVCTDTVCFGMKKAAHVLVLQKAAEAKGHEVIVGKAAEKIIKSKYNSTYELRDAGLAKLKDIVPNDPKMRTWEQMLKSAKLIDPPKNSAHAAVKLTLVEDPFRQEMISTVNIETAVKALREAGFEMVKKGVDGQSQSQSKQAKAAKVQAEGAKAYMTRLFDTLHQHIETDLIGTKANVDPIIYQALAQVAFEQAYTNAAHVARKIWPDSGIGNAEELCSQFKERIPSLTTQQHFMILVDCMLTEELAVPSWKLAQGGGQPENMELIAKTIGIDADAIKKEVEEEIKAKQKTLSAKKPVVKTASTSNIAAPAVKKTPPKKKAAQAAKATA